MDGVAMHSSPGSARPGSGGRDRDLRRL